MASSNKQHLLDTSSEASCNSTRNLHSSSKIGIKLIMQCFILILSVRLGYSTNDPDVEGEALVDLLNALNDSRNSITDWNLNLVSPCFSWSHVICRDGHVIALSLASHGFSGTLSPSISKLKFLVNLELQDNNLSGRLPNYISSLLDLQNLDLARNQLTGSIPSSWVQLTKLKHLDLSSNDLRGSIPPQLFSVPTFNFTGTHLTCGLSSDQPCVLSSSSPDKTKSSKLVAVLLISGCSCASILLLGALLIYRYHKLQKFESAAFADVDGEDERIFSFGHVRRFSWREIQIATENFNENNVIGSGGFGKVYKGILADGTTIAVKRLADYHSPGGEDAFLREVQLISAAVHKNLLRLIGFCTTSSEKILVYPFMKNLSVANCLRDLKPGEKGLDWPTRKKVAFGTGHGLEYLHEHCNPKIIHRDLKASNILLDENFEAALGDFGLAKLVDANLTHVTTQVRGTMGHIAPEYLSTGKSSEKTDVFGYGITLLELVTGQRTIDFSRLEEEEEVLLLDHIKKLVREKRLFDIVDSNLSGEYDAEEVEMMVRVALLCTQDRPGDRPKMAEVVTLLGGVGLTDRWEEWEKMEEEKNRELQTSMMAHHRFAWGEESMEDQCVVHLSSPR